MTVDVPGDIHRDLIERRHQVVRVVNRAYLNQRFTVLREGELGPAGDAVPITSSVHALWTPSVPIREDLCNWFATPMGVNGLGERNT